MKKRIITWPIGDNPQQVVSRGFIFGNYGTKATDYDLLIAEALNDFPQLKRSEIDLSKVTKSSSILHFAVVSFPLPKNTQHSEYDPWDRFDFNY